MSSDRRKFIKQLGGTIVLTSASLSSFAGMEDHERRILQAEKRYSSNDKIRIATIGMGIMGFNDTRAALTCPVAKSIHPDIEVNVQFGWPAFAAQL